MRVKKWSYLALVALVLATIGVANAEGIGKGAFRNVWERTDIPVRRGIGGRSWIWGPEPFTPLLREQFVDGQGGRRDVQYFDKSRMEINDPNADQNSPWYVTNGLLVSEMVRGRVQIGYDQFIALGPANIPLAGDPDNDFPTYASLARIYNTPVGYKDGDHVTSVFLREGSAQLPQYADSPATEITRLSKGFGIPRAFWDFMNQRGPIYVNGKIVENQTAFDWLFVMGYPTTDAYWTRVRVGGVDKEVMFQAFERRVLTYVPSNPPAFQVEMGNVGQHYYQWRYVSPFADGKKALITEPAHAESPPSVRSPLPVAGFENGSAFEAAITVRLKNKGTDAEIAKAHTTVVRPDIGKPGPFSVVLEFAPPPTDTLAVLQVLTTSPRDGSEIILDSFDVVVKKAG